MCPPGYAVVIILEWEHQTMLDPTAATPLYVQLMELLERQIVTGERDPGERLPSEAELARQFDVSIITVRSAVGGLCKRGLVERKQGKGTFVKKVEGTRDIRNLEGFSDSCLRQGIEPGGRMLVNQPVTLSDKTSHALGQPQGAQGIYISRLRFADGKPVAIEKNYFPQQYSFLLGERFDNRSLFQFLKEQAQVSVARADKRIELCQATTEEGKLLQVAAGTPMLFIKSTAYTQSGEPLYVGTQIMNGERFSLQITQYAYH